MIQMCVVSLVLLHSLFFRRIYLGTGFVPCIRKSLVFQSNWYIDRIIFNNNIIIYKHTNKGDRNFHKRIKKWKKGGIFDILNDISEYVTLC